MPSLELPQRQQRPVPLLLAAVGFGAAALLLARQPQHVDALLPRMLAGMAVAITLVVSLRWKISAHGVGVGGAVGLFGLLHSGPHGGALTDNWLLGSVLLAAAVGAARLVLNTHTPAQVAAGLALGAAVAAACGGAL